MTYNFIMSRYYQLVGYCRHLCCMIILYMVAVHAFSVNAPQEAGQWLVAINPSDASSFVL